MMNFIKVGMIFGLLCISSVFGVLNYYTDGTIDHNITDDSVYVWNNAEVTMTGGTLTSMDLFNTSSLEMQNGTISHGLSAWGQSQLALYNGSVETFLESHDSGIIDIYGGDINGWLYADGASTVRLYAYGVEFDQCAGQWNGGQLTGFWVANQQAFTIDLLNNLDAEVVTYDHIQIIPEPVTVILLGLGGLVLRKRK